MSSSIIKLHRYRLFYKFYAYVNRSRRCILHVDIQPVKLRDLCCRECVALFVQVRTIRYERERERKARKWKRLLGYKRACTSRDWDDDDCRSIHESRKRNVSSYFHSNPVSISSSRSWLLSISFYVNIEWGTHLKTSTICIFQYFPSWFDYVQPPADTISIISIELLFLPLWRWLLLNSMLTDKEVFWTDK